MKKIEVNIEGMSKDEMERVREILGALISSGGLFGVKGGQTIMHFDPNGEFVGVQLSYWPYRRRKKID